MSLYRDSVGPKELRHSNIWHLAAPFRIGSHRNEHYLCVRTLCCWSANASLTASQVNDPAVNSIPYDDLKIRLRLRIMNYLLEEIDLRKSLVRATSNMEGVFQTYEHPSTQGCVSICSISDTYRGSHPTASTVTATFDASLKWAGVVWHSNINGAEVAGCVAALDHSSLSFTSHLRACPSSLELL